MSFKYDRTENGGFANCFPGLRRWLDYPHVASMACPKAMLFINGSQDKLFPVAGVEKAFMTMHDTWESQGAGDKIGLEWFDWLQCHCPYDHLIWEQRLTWIDAHPYLRCWIHISCRRKLDKNRQQVLVLKK